MSTESICNGLSVERKFIAKLPVEWKFIGAISGVRRDGSMRRSVLMFRDTFGTCALDTAKRWLHSVSKLCFADEKQETEEEKKIKNERHRYPTLVLQVSI